MLFTAIFFKSESKQIWWRHDISISKSFGSFVVCPRPSVPSVDRWTRRRWVLPMPYSLLPYIYLFDCFILLRRLLALFLCSSRIQKGVSLRILCWTYGKFLFGLSIDLVVSDMGDCACAEGSVSSSSPSEPKFTWWTCWLVPWSWSSVAKHCVRTLQSRIADGIFHGNGLTENTCMCWNMPRRQDRQRVSRWKIWLSPAKGTKSDDTSIYLLMVVERIIWWYNKTTLLTQSWDNSNCNSNWNLMPNHPSRKSSANTTANYSCPFFNSQ